MPHFISQGVQIDYKIHGEGPPVLLIHGFASNGDVNWVATNWVKELNAAGYQAITIDNRGHGKSEKLYDSALYDARIMAADAVNLIDHLGLGKIVVMGYSMGARITGFMCLDAPEKIAGAIFGGMGISMVHGMSNSQDIADALLAPSLDDVTTQAGRMFRLFAEHTGSDLRALAACMMSSRSKISAAAAGGMDVPILVAVGSDDEVGGSAEELAQLLPQGEAFVIERRDHMRATGDPAYKKATLAFLNRVYPIVI